MQVSVQDSFQVSILIIEDEQNLAEAFQMMLIKLYEVQTVLTGKAGLEQLLSEKHFDIILCDLSLPDLSGMELYSTIKASKPGLEQNFMFLTGGAFTKQSQVFLQSVSNPVLNKPILAKELREKVNEMVQAKRTLNIHA